MSSVPNDDFFNSPASMVFSNTSARQRTQQACDKCRERKTKCSGEKPMCRRCTTRNLSCQYSHRETRPRGSANSLRSSVSNIELRRSAESNAFNSSPEQAYSNYLTPYPSAAQFQNEHRPPQQPQRLTPFEVHSQPASASGSPEYSAFSVQQLEYSPTSSEGSFMFPDLPPAGPSMNRQVRRVQSQSALSHSLRPRSSFPSLSRSYHHQHPNHHASARSLDMTFDPPPYIRSKYPGGNGMEDTMGFSSLYYSDSILPPIASMQANGRQLTPPIDPALYDSAPALPSLYDPRLNAHMLDSHAQEHDSAMEKYDAAMKY
ncbi:hypothetical protein CYLTODRAFT_451128 [Cylindrobasidium torrendii FP15055 ss-10]|uniref:Zn(2)-C6 fungal-type domain-containing protein n=1 Tax=Cylindrobasidium torrendii FP15055 ss-10 TaxID=1314674 RepID=A0A0D7BKM6_9AGAR|nr:hypothetical protein CYLTODRAFT_451128 [Cylindrobasidium torrendii FP15055 ss-10]